MKYGLTKEEIEKYREKLSYGEYYKQILRVVKNESQDRDPSWNLLTHGAYGGRLDYVKIALKNGYDIDSSDGQALRNAISQNHPDIVKYLLDHGASTAHINDNTFLDVNNSEIILAVTSKIDDPELKRQIFIEAVYKHDIIVVEGLLNLGMDPNTVGDDRGSIVLEIASRYGYLDMVKLLHSHGATITQNALKESRGDVRKYLQEQIKK